MPGKTKLKQDFESISGVVSQLQIQRGNFKLIGHVTSMIPCKDSRVFYFSFNPKRCGLFGGVLFGEMKFVLSNCLSSEDLSI